MGTDSTLVLNVVVDERGNGGLSQSIKTFLRRNSFSFREYSDTFAVSITKELKSFE